MLLLKNIKIGKTVAEADFIPEDSPETGHIVVDLATEEIISVENVKGYEPPFGGSYRGHAVQALVEMARDVDTSTERLVMWY